MINFELNLVGNGSVVYLGVFASVKEAKKAAEFDAQQDGTRIRKWIQDGLRTAPRTDRRTGIKHQYVVSTTREEVDNPLAGLLAA